MTNNQTLKEIRTGMGVPQHDFARMSQIGHYTYNQIENKKILPSDKQAKRIADVLGMEVSELFSETRPYDRGFSGHRYSEKANQLLGELRIQAEIPQHDFAYMAGMSDVTYRRIEDQKVLPTAEQAQRIADVFGVQYQELFPEVRANPVGSFFSLSLSKKSDSKDYLQNYALRKARIELRLSAKKVAEMSAIGVSLYRAYESLRANPTEENKGKIAKTLGKSAEELFSDTLRGLVTELRVERGESPEKISPQPQLQSLEETSEHELPPVYPIGFDELCSFSEKSQLIRNALSTLDSQERSVIELRYGLNGSVHTLEEVGKKLGVTGERVRQIEFTAISRLQHPSRSETLLSLIG